MNKRPFSKFNRREIDVRFDGGNVSSKGGLLLLREVERRQGLLGEVARILPNPRHPALIEHTTEHLLRQRVFGLCQGYEDLNDHDGLHDDLWHCNPRSNATSRPHPVPRCTASRVGTIADPPW